jgi:hypothetical protein
MASFHAADRRRQAVLANVTSRARGAGPLEVSRGPSGGPARTDAGPRALPFDPSGEHAKGSRADGGSSSQGPQGKVWDSSPGSSSQDLKIRSGGGEMGSSGWQSSR